jgi:DNA modification methylase
MQTTQMPINSLIFAEYNPRQISKHDFQKLVQSIKEFGFIEPVVINKDKTIIGGHMRVRAAKELNMAEVPCVEVDLPKEKEKALNLALNRIHGEWDEQKLAEVLFELENMPELELTGFSESEVAKVLDTVRLAKEDEFDVKKELEAIKEPVTKQGDLYQLGRHRLLCGDATVTEDWSHLMGDEKANLIFTDPPYNVNYESPAGNTYSSTKYGDSGKIFNDNKSDEDCVAFYTAVLKNLLNYSADDAPIYWWFANKNNHLNRLAFEQAGWYFSQIIIWLKNSFVFSLGQDYHRAYEPCMFGWKKGKAHYVNKQYGNLADVFNTNFAEFEEMLDIWYAHRDNTNDYVHPTQKPTKLAERALKRSSKIGSIVVDAFGGSGSTLIACENMNRIAYLMELDPKFVDVIIKRWEQFTGEKAVKL